MAPDDHAQADTAPPRTRGSPRRRSPASERAGGSPAHAGIALLKAFTGATSRGLPRARGDRPRSPEADQDPRPAPPRTRGSPPVRGVGVHRDEGSPAHAGIAPYDAQDRRPLHRLPRARGDRPPPLRRRGSGVLAPPRTRGSPRVEVPLRRRAGGSPAHAGIAPPPSDPPGTGRGLPRARGDRPAASPVSVLVPEAPPRTRGSPLRQRRGVLRALGSPAHAGIAPSPGRGGPASRWLPRARGDRPHARLLGAAHFTAPPRTRGSPRRDEVLHSQGAGSPAHAGIAPSDGPRRSGAARLPRARGDRPARRWPGAGALRAPPRTRGSPRLLPPLAFQVQGSPAHAGIAPRPPGMKIIRRRLPRARGDRPHHTRRPRVTLRAPPRTRGSPRPRPQDVLDLDGSPAHAGIAPGRRRAWSQPAGLPRARGDRPFPSSVRHRGRGAPPRTRGSPQAQASRAEPADGSPAHAGIAPDVPKSLQVGYGLPRARGDRPAEVP